MEPLPEEFELLSKVRIPRCYINHSEQNATYELHVFSDACERTCAAVIYFRISYGGDCVEVSFVASKTCVAPIKKQSIPRLELMGATLLRRLLKMVKTIFQPRSLLKVGWIHTQLCD